jgi:hypothetical protein
MKYLCLRLIPSLLQSTEGADKHKKELMQNNGRSNAVARF